MPHQVDFTALLTRPGFRADLLYFIRMAGTYIETIFLDARVNWKDNRLKSFQTIIDGLKEKNPKYDKNWIALRKQDPGIEFAAKDAFKLLLAHLETTHKSSLSRRLQWEHALPWSFDIYYHKVEQLRAYRNFLEHPDGKTKPDDDELLHTLGLLLLPHLQNHLIGRIIHHQRKLAKPSPSPLGGEGRGEGGEGGQHSGFRTSSPQPSPSKEREFTAAVRDILQKAETDRRETSRNIFGLKTRQTLPKNERIDRETYNNRWKERFADWFASDTWPRYNEHNFKVRYHFIGRRRLALLGTALQSSPSTKGYFNDPARSDFIRELEPIYYASLDINLILQKFLFEMKSLKLEVGSAKKMKNSIPALRNEIAHGGFFWAVADKDNAGQVVSLETLFGDLLSLPAKADMPNIKERQNDLITAIAGVIKNYGAHRVHDSEKIGDDPNKRPPPYIIHRWTAEKRARYADSKRYTIDRRPRVRALLASWKRALAMAESNSKSDKKN
jgi:hypothetical protein